jgi:hypothetical protein
MENISELEAFAHSFVKTCKVRQMSAVQVKRACLAIGRVVPGVDQVFAKLGYVKESENSDLSRFSSTPTAQNAGIDPMASPTTPASSFLSQHIQRKLKERGKKAIDPQNPQISGSELAWGSEAGRRAISSVDAQRRGTQTGVNPAPQPSAPIRWHAWSHTSAGRQ